MKFGVIWHKTTMNMGDDIQTYAAANHLPQVDYVIERENTDKFCSKDHEPVAVLMNAWWMWQKWNWPPAECIVPKLTSMHINNYTVAKKSSPISDEWMQGIGGKFFRENGPVGARDQVTLDFLKERGIDSYFSGCMTLTLPKQKVTKDAGTYVCLVDLNEKLEKAAREMLKDTGLKVRVLSHDCDYRTSNASYEKRMQKVQDLLTEYQNAKCVITRRLHVSLPCLAMEVPVFSVVDMKNDGNSSRWAPYADWVHYVSNEDFVNGNFEYDFLNPPANKPNYLQTREALIADVAKFVEEMRDCELPIEQVKKTSYTEEEARIWQNDLMHYTLELWREQSQELVEEKNMYQKQVEECKNIIRKMEKGKDVVALLEKKIDIQKKKKSALTKKVGKKMKQIFRI